jgi:Skp family chaperone for outer membrane proteins
MDPGQIWDSAWTRLKGMDLGIEHAAAIDAAARRSAGARNPVAPFWGHLDDCLARAEEFRAEREAAQREAQRLADEAREEQRKADEKREQQRLKREQAEAKAEQDGKDREERDRQERERLAALAERIEEYLAGHMGRSYDDIAADVGLDASDVRHVTMYDRELSPRFRGYHGRVVCLPSQHEQVIAEQEVIRLAQEAADKEAALDALEQEIRRVVRADGEISDTLLRMTVLTKLLKSGVCIDPVRFGEFKTGLDRVLESGDVVISERITIAGSTGAYLRLKWTGNPEV